MRKIKSIISIEEIKTQKYGGHANFYLDHDMPIVYGKCPDCGCDIHRGGVSCPDGRDGCLVCHYGYGCSGCRKVFEMAFEYEPSTEPEKPFTISEKIGIAIVNPRGVAQGRKSVIIGDNNDE